MDRIRRWSVRHARSMETLYLWVERHLIALAPLFRRIGYARVERPVAAVERFVKQTLFDCEMCGQCVLNKTGMSCPMNCPKSIRNGPCGGVRADGYCEVKPDMRCVWVDAWDGSRRMQDGGDIRVVQFAVDYRLKGSSSLLRVVREKTDSPVTELASGSTEPDKPINANPSKVGDPHSQAKTSMRTNGDSQ